MLRLTLARFLVSAVPLRRWRRLLGPLCEPSKSIALPDPVALVLARAVNRGAARLPFETKCLPRAMALHAMLRRRRLPSVLVIGVLDPSQRGTIEDLHAWVESGDAVIIGALEEPFRPLARFGNGN
jgi:Transglutaminase-like superfamily